jgi:large subunit ribosomal protein L15
VDRESLLAKGLAKGRFDLLKILGQGELKTALTVVADRFSKSAIEKIEAAGGTVQVVGAE